LSLQPDSLAAPHALATYHGILGDFDAIADWLSKAIGQHDPAILSMLRLWFGRDPRNTARWATVHGLFATRISITAPLRSDRTATNSPPFPEVITQGTCSYSSMSQYLPTRFRVSAAGRFAAISRGMET
jgi:hypothetical protein